MPAKSKVDFSPKKSIRIRQTVGLVYVSDDSPGIRPIRTGKTFRYVSARGRTIHDHGQENAVKHRALSDSCRLERGLDLLLSARPLASYGARCAGAQAVPLSS